MSKLINEEKVEEKVILEESNTVFEDTFNQQESLSGEPGPPTVFENTVSLEDICYRSNENFEIDKPVTLERTKSTIINQVKINNLIKLKKW